MRKPLGAGITAVVPMTWIVGISDGVVEVHSPTLSTVVHISIFRRTVTSDPRAGEARKMVESFPIWAARGTTHGAIVETPGTQEVTAFGSCIDENGATWDIGAKVGRVRALIFSFTSSTPTAVERSYARKLFESVDGLNAFSFFSK
jgi:hypothetical protein